MFTSNGGSNKVWNEIARGIGAHNIKLGTEVLGTSGEHWAGGLNGTVALGGNWDSVWTVSMV